MKSAHSLGKILQCVFRILKSKTMKLIKSYRRSKEKSNKKLLQKQRKASGNMANITK